MMAWDWAQFWPQLVAGLLIVGIALIIEAYLDERREKRHRR